MSQARQENYWKGLGEADRPADGSSSRPSKNNRQAPSEEGESSVFDFGQESLPDGTALRPLSVQPGETLREEAVLEGEESARSRPWYAVVNAWRSWYRGYKNAHMEFENPEGETVRAQLENSYQPRYGKRYYGKLKDLERGIERTYENLTTVMLTFSASNKNTSGGFRAPGDHMREIADGWDVARKQLHQVLEGERWEYARVWEPHESGYGHLHIGVFVDAAELEAERFKPVMESYVNNTKPAAMDVHENEACASHEEPEASCEDCRTPISVNDDVNNLGTYISEYIGVFGEEPTERPVSEQMFYATTWATNTRRVDFSNGAQEIQTRERFRRETGLVPEGRGGTEALDRWRGSSSSSGSPESVDIDPESESIDVGKKDGGGGWSAESIVRVEGATSREAHDPTGGGVTMVAIDGAPDTDQAVER